MTLNCSSCGATNRDGASFCLGCGSRLVPTPSPAPPSAPSDPVWSATTSGPDDAARIRRCAACGVENRAADNFCKACGTPVGTGAATTVMPVTPASPHRKQSSKAPIIAFTVVALLLFSGAAFVLLSGRGDDAAINIDGESEVVADEDDGDEPTAASAPSSSIGDDAVGTTIPAQVIPTTTPATVATTLPPPPVTTVAPTLPEVVPGDLGLAQPMLRPPCDDTYITVLASALDPATDATVVADALARYPGSEYLKTIETCPSLRPAVDGAEIYVVYFGPFLTEAEACAGRSAGPSDAYVRMLSLTVPDTHRILC